MSKKSDIIIKCPKCGREYLPAEIYLPDSFLGKPKNIFKDDNGRIDDYMGKNMDLKEEFICDGCGVKFDIAAKVSFNSTISKTDTKVPYKTKIIINKFELDED